MDPESFRLALNSLLQDLRNVTFLLQKQKNELPDFVRWYEPWQRAAKIDPVMRWAVEARNRVVKQSDLDLHSRALVRLSRGWTEDIEDDLYLPPQYSTHQIISGLLAKAPVNQRRGVMTIERRWVDPELPTWEVLGAVGHAFDGLVKIVKAAHEAAGVPTCDLPSRKPECVNSGLQSGLLCMQEVDDDRRLHVDLDTMRQLVESVIRIGVDDIPRQVSLDRYGPFTSSGDAIARLPQATEMAKHLLRIDRSLATVAWLIRERKMVSLVPILLPDDMPQQLIIMHQLAEKVEQYGADGVVLIGECWTAWAAPGEDPENPATRASQRLDRSEAIGVTAISRDGRIANSTTIFFRGMDGEIYIGPSHFARGWAGNINMLLPVVRKWSEDSTLED